MVMWDGSITRPYRNLGIRKFFRFAASTMTAVLLLTTLNSQMAMAADASWNGSSILYAGNSYTSAGLPPEGSGLTIPKGSPMYMYTEGSAGTQKAHIIYFSPNGDPTAATSANYVIYDFTPPGTYANPSGERTLTLEASAGGGDLGGQSCAIPGGLGWFLCPLADAMANAADSIYSIVAWFLTVPPAPTDQDSPLYRAWSIARNFANLAFVGAFLMIIYSQITGFGLTNYGLKRLLPKLIVSAILVNLSYWICAIGIDLSNIAGYSVERFFAMLRDSVAGGRDAAQPFVYNWRGVVLAVVSGGTAVAAGTAGLIAIGSVGIVGVIWYLLPILIGVIASLLIALFVLAARQAIIMVLVIIAPLAFVAMLLPNTEKYFKWWENTFTTLLMVFPAIGFVFGGAALAGAAIMNSSEGSILVVILGMAIQVAPLAITPLLLKFSGGLVSRITGVVNNPQRGLIDRSRNYAREQTDLRRAQAMADRSPGGLRWGAQFLDSRKRRRASLTKNFQSAADNRFKTSRTGFNLDQQTRDIQDQGRAIDAEHSNAYSDSATGRVNYVRTSDAQRIGDNIKTDLQRVYLEGLPVDVRLEPHLKKLELSRINKEVEAEFAELEAHRVPINVAPGTDLHTRLGLMADQAHRAEEIVALTGMRQQAAQRVQQSNIAKAIVANPVRPGTAGHNFQEYGGGIQGDEGAQRVLARALQQQSTEWGEQVKERSAVIGRLNPEQATFSKMVDFVSGTADLVGEDPLTGQNITMSRDDIAAREATIDLLMHKGSAPEMLKIVMMSGRDEFKQNRYSQTIGSVTPEVASKKIPYLSGSNIARIQQGKIQGEDGLDWMVAEWLAGGKMNANALAALPENEVRRVFQVIKSDPADLTSRFGWDATRDAEKFAHFTQAQNNIAALARNITSHQEDYSGAETATFRALESIATAPSWRAATLAPPTTYNLPPVRPPRP